MTAADDGAMRIEVVRAAATTTVADAIGRKLARLTCVSEVEVRPAG